MEGGMNLLEWLPMLVVIMGGAAVALAYTRTRARLERVQHDNEGLSRIIDQANDAVLVLDFVNGRIHRANPRAAEMIGCSQEELASRTVFDLHFTEDLQRSAARIADAWSAGGLVYDDIPFRTADGRSLPVECSAKVTSYEEKPAVVLYVRDISERQRMQREIAEKNALVEQRNNEMRSSLRYAHGIQSGMLPSLGQLRASFSDAFVLFRPRDIVSGDFYWSARIGPRVLVAAADCTGHGVPGALLSMTGIALLQQIVVGKGLTAPAEVLSVLREELLRALVHQEGEGQLRDGMNIGLITYDTATGECEFSGALCPLYILRKDGTLEEIKGDRFPVGFVEEVPIPFTPHLFELRKGDRLYMASDGFADQFGGPMGKKLKTAGLKELLAATSDRSTCRQGKDLEKAFDAWTGTNEQVDDVMVIGLQV